MIKYTLFIITFFAINHHDDLETNTYESYIDNHYQILTDIIFAATNNFLIAAKVHNDIKEGYKKFLKYSRNKRMHAKLEDK